MTALLMACDYHAFPAAAFAVVHPLSAKGFDDPLLVGPETPFFSRAAMREEI